jgi:hypothetical protein
MATKSNNHVFIVLFTHCLQFDYSRNLVILQRFDHFWTWWPPRHDFNLSRNKYLTLFFFILIVGFSSRL